MFQLFLSKQQFGGRSYNRFIRPEFKVQNFEPCMGNDLVFLARKAVRLRKENTSGHRSDKESGALSGEPLRGRVYRQQRQ